MAANLNDVIQMTVIQEQAGQQVLNVYHYQVVTLTGLDGDYLQVLIDHFNDEIKPQIVALQSNALAYKGIRVVNLTNGVDFLEYTYPASTTGQVATDALPPNVTYTFRLLRETLATRHGYKRFSGVAESMQNNGVFAGNQAIIDNLRGELASDVQPAPSVVPLMAPVIVRKDATGAVIAVNNIGGSDFRGIGTQNTRKIGRGV